MTGSHSASILLERGGKLPWGLAISFLIHLIGFFVIIIYSVLADRRPAEVPVFELVQLEKPKLRPLTPKVKPPDPKPKPKPEKTPDPPKLTPKPEQPKPKPKPEPEVVRDQAPEVTEDISRVEEQVLTQQTLHVPTDPRLSFWAKRVKNKVETQWNPPKGINILQDSKVVVSFIVHRDGKVDSESLETATGNQILDDVALMTIKRLDRVPPIPPHYPEDKIQVRYEFVYKAQ